MRSQKGFSLIEALVAFLLLSIGMLGIASLQTISLKSGRTAVYRTAAVMKVDEILARIRANVQAVSISTRIDSAIASKYVVDTSGSGSDNSCSQTGSAAQFCDTDQLAADDIFRWKSSLQDILPPSATAKIDITDATPAALPPTMVSIVTVTVTWNERNQQAAGVTSVNYSVSVQM